MDDIDECKICGRFIFDNYCNKCATSDKIYLGYELDYFGYFLRQNKNYLHLDSVVLHREGQLYNPFNRTHFVEYDTDTIMIQSNIMINLNKKGTIIKYKDRKIIYELYCTWVKLVCNIMENYFPDELSGYLDYDLLETRATIIKYKKSLECRNGKCMSHCQVCKVKWMKVPNIIKISHYVDRKYDIRRNDRISKYPYILTILRSFIKGDGLFKDLSRDTIISILRQLSHFKSSRLYNIYDRLKNILIKID